jgi:hypothetical protein
MYRRKLGIAEAQYLLDELYLLFKKFGISREEFNRWINEIVIDRKKTEGCLIDLILCPFVKHGLSPQHLRSLSRRLQHKKFRARRLAERLEYISKCIVKRSY